MKLKARLKGSVASIQMNKLFNQVLPSLRVDTAEEMIRDLSRSEKRAFVKELAARVLEE